MKKRSSQRRARLFFFAACAGVLAAGMIAVAAAGRFAPTRQVTTRTALPVYNALGVESADVLFWPEEIWEGYFLTDVARRQENTGLVSGFARPWLLLAGWDAGMEGGLPGSYWQISARGSKCFYARDVRFSQSLPGGDGVPRPLEAQVSAGRQDDSFAISCRVWAADGYQDLPDDWQETAVQRCQEELMYLFNLSGDEQRAGLFSFLNTMFEMRISQLSEVQFNDDETTLWWQEQGMLNMDDLLYQMAYIMRQGQKQVMLYCHKLSWIPEKEVYEGLYPHETISGSEPLDTADLAWALTDVGMDAQVVPMEDQVMVLFSWELFDLAVYYDPVLDCFSGYSLQT